MSHLVTNNTALVEKCYGMCKIVYERTMSCTIWNVKTFTLSCTVSTNLLKMLSNFFLVKKHSFLSNFTIFNEFEYTLGQIQISLLRSVSVSNKSTLICGSVGGAMEWPHTCTLGTFLLCPLALSMPTYSNY